MLTLLKPFHVSPLPSGERPGSQGPPQASSCLLYSFFSHLSSSWEPYNWPTSIRNAYHPDLPDLFHFLLPVTHTYMHMCTYTCTHTYQLPPPQYHPAPCTHSLSQLESHCIIFVCACSASPETEVLRAEATSDFLLHP